MRRRLCASGRSDLSSSHPETTVNRQSNTLGERLHCCAPPYTNAPDVDHVFHLLSGICYYGLATGPHQL